MEWIQSAADMTHIVVRLVTAAAVGFLITAVRKTATTEPIISRPIDQAQVLVCVAGALSMMLIGDSTARALCILGGAAIVRFRATVDNPRDAALMFLLLGLGIAIGQGLFMIAAIGVALLCIILFKLEDAQDQKPAALPIQFPRYAPDIPKPPVGNERYAA